MNERAHNDVVVGALMKLVEKAPFEATVGELFENLTVSRNHFDRSFPATPAHLSRQLKRLKPAMAHMGLFIEFIGHRRSGTIVKVWNEGQEPGSSSPIWTPAREKGF